MGMLMEAFLDLGRRLLQEANLEEWVFIINAISEKTISAEQSDVIPETSEVSVPVSLSPWEPTKSQDNSCSWERLEAPLPLLQTRSTCERLELPFSSDAILSGYKDLVLSGSDHFTLCGKICRDELLTEHVVDIRIILQQIP